MNVATLFFLFLFRPFCWVSVINLGAKSLTQFVSIFFTAALGKCCDKIITINLQRLHFIVLIKWCSILFYFIISDNVIMIISMSTWDVFEGNLLDFIKIFPTAFLCNFYPQTIFVYGMSTPNDAAIFQAKFFEKGLDGSAIIPPPPFPQLCSFGTSSLNHSNTCTHIWMGQETFSCKINYPASWIKGAWHVLGGKGEWKAEEWKKRRGYSTTD